MRTTESPVSYRQQMQPNSTLPTQALSKAQQLTSHKQHLALLLHRAHLAIAALVLFIDSVNRLFHLAEHQVAMAVVCLIESNPGQHILFNSSSPPVEEHLMKTLT